jgi:hypothetical protein
LRQRNFGVAGGVLRKGPHDLHAKTFMQTAAGEAKGAAGNLLLSHILTMSGVYKLWTSSLLCKLRYRPVGGERGFLFAFIVIIVI